MPYAELPGAVKKIVGDTPIAYVYDAVSNAESQKAGWDALSPGGALVIVLPPSPAVGKQGQDDEKGRRTVWVAGIVSDPYHEAFGNGLYAALTGLLENGDIKVRHFTPYAEARG